MGGFDLHMHSAASDGTDDPAALPALAAAAGLAGIALTDHDTAAGIEACRAAADDLDLAFVAGVELSADPTPLRPRAEPPGARLGNLHLLGYGIDPQHPGLLEVQRRLLDARAQRNPQIVANLEALGVTISYDEVVQAAGGQVVGRPHIAQVLVRKGYVKSIHEAFARYIGEGAAAYARKDRLSAEEAIATIHSAGGVAVLAHPVQLRLPDAQSLGLAVKRLKDFGLDGIEVHHTDHRAEDVRQHQSLARDYDLLSTGGSDYHGFRKSIAIGEVCAPKAMFDELMDAIAQRQPA